MNFLEIVQKTARGCQIGGTGPSTVVSQTGEAKKIVDFCNDAWMDIQGIHQDWGWLRTSLAGFVTVDLQATYTPTQCGATDFGMWERYSFKNYLTTGGTAVEIEMQYMDYEDWRREYQLGPMRTSTSQPEHFTITPAKSIGLGPVPTGAYTVTGDYFKAPTEMSANADIAAMPEHYHMAIVYRAMMMYGEDRAQSEVYSRGRKGYLDYINRLEGDYLPEITL